MKNYKNSYFYNSLKNGWMPGTEFVILKAFIKLGIVIYAGSILISLLDSINQQEILNTYREVAEKHANEIREALKDNTGNWKLPPLETLTDILNGVKDLSLDDKVSYLLEHKRALLNLLKNDQTLTADDVTNLFEIIKYISKEANEANELAIKKIAQDAIQSIKGIKK
jgi:hypothetical protein